MSYTAYVAISGQGPISVEIPSGQWTVGELIRSAGYTIEATDITYEGNILSPHETMDEAGVVEGTVLVLTLNPQTHAELCIKATYKSIDFTKQPFRTLLKGIIDNCNWELLGHALTLLEFNSMKNGQYGSRSDVAEQIGRLFNSCIPSSITEILYGCPNFTACLREHHEVYFEAVKDPKQLEKAFHCIGPVAGGCTIVGKYFDELHAASFRTFKMLLHNGCDLNSLIDPYMLSRYANHTSSTIFMVLLQMKIPKDHLDEIFNPNITHPIDLTQRDTMQCTPLMYAASGQNRRELVPYLVENGANINDKDKNGRNALHYYLQNCTEPVPECLYPLRTSRDKSGKPPSFFAVKDKLTSSEVVKWVLKCPEVHTMRDNANDTILMFAVRGSRPHFASVLAHAQAVLDPEEFHAYLHHKNFAKMDVSHLALRRQGFRIVRKLAGLGMPLLKISTKKS